MDIHPNYLSQVINERFQRNFLNTAAKIQAKCNEVGFDLLVHESLVSSIRLDKRMEFEKVGATFLRGKAEEVVVYGFDKRASSTGLEVSVSK